MGFFDRFYYGKAGQADYTEDDLPSNRFQLFWQVLRVRLWSLVRLNLIQLLFWIPMLLVTLLTFMAANTIDVNASGEEIANHLLGLLSNFAILLIPCILITGPSTAAASYVARNWARDQHSFLWSDFKDAFKANWKQGLLISAITSVLPFLLLIGVQFYGSLAQSNAIAIIPQVMMVIVGVVWALALVFAYPLMVGYQLRVRQLFRNSMLLAIGRLPFAVAIRLATLLPMIIGLVVFVFLGSAYGLLFIALYYLLIGFAMSRLVNASFANSVFDRYINPNIEGAPVNLGLRENDEEDEDE